MIGFVHLSWLERDVRFHPHLRRGRPVAAYVLGLAFAFGWTPCIGPVLGAILTASAVGATAREGVLLLAVYSLGPPTHDLSGLRPGMHAQVVGAWHPDTDEIDLATIYA